MQASVTQPRLSWRLNQLSQATGLSVPFLRNEVRAGRLKTRKVGAAVIVLDGDAREFLEGEKQEAQESETSLAATV